MKVSPEIQYAIESDAVYFFLNKLLKKMIKLKKDSLTYQEISNLAIVMEKELKK